MNQKVIGNYFKSLTIVTAVTAIFCVLQNTYAVNPSRDHLPPPLTIGKSANHEACASGSSTSTCNYEYRNPNYRIPRSLEFESSGKVYSLKSGNYLNLNNQLGPSLKQPTGTCYAAVIVDSFRAARFRATGVPVGRPNYENTVFFTHPSNRDPSWHFLKSFRSSQVMDAEAIRRVTSQVSGGILPASTTVGKRNTGGAQPSTFDLDKLNSILGGKKQYVPRYTVAQTNKTFGWGGMTFPFAYTMARDPVTRNSFLLSTNVYHQFQGEFNKWFQASFRSKPGDEEFTSIEINQKYKEFLKGLDQKFATIANSQSRAVFQLIAQEQKEELEYFVIPLRDFNYSQSIQMSKNQRAYYSRMFGENYDSEVARILKAAPKDYFNPRLVSYGNHQVRNKANRETFTSTYLLRNGGKMKHTKTTGFDVPDLNYDDKVLKALIEDKLRHGIPVIIGYNHDKVQLLTHKGKWVDWIRRDYEHSGHQAQIIGEFKDGLLGTEYYLVRNSQSKGHENNPLSSFFRLPKSWTSVIAFAYTIETQADFERVSYDEALAKSGSQSEDDDVDEVAENVEMPFIRYGSDYVYYGRGHPSISGINWVGGK